MQFIIDAIYNHWHYFWFISIPTIVSILFFIGTLIYKARLGLRSKEDETKALKAVSDLVRDVNGREAKALVMTRNLFGGDSKDDGVLVDFGNGRARFLKPESSAMSAVRFYLAKHERAQMVTIVAFYVFATCFVAYIISWVAYFILFH